MGTNDTYRTRTTEPELGKHQQNMTRDEQIQAVLSAPVPVCPNCGHGMDPHGFDPGGICGVGDEDSVRCPCLMTPSAIHNHERRAVLKCNDTNWRPGLARSSQR